MSNTQLCNQLLKNCASWFGQIIIAQQTEVLENIVLRTVGSAKVEKLIVIGKLIPAYIWRMIRPAVLSLFFCLFFGVVRADEPSGIRFFNGSWQDVLAESKRLNKPIFVDFYTTWCPPCRRMAREAFPNVAVGAKFNEHFISYQVNAELGEGFNLAKRYVVQSYPTALYIIPTGELVHRAVGYAGVNAMLQQADMVLAMPKVRRSRRKRTDTNYLSNPTLVTQPDSVER